MPFVTGPTRTFRVLVAIAFGVGSATVVRAVGAIRLGVAEAATAESIQPAPGKIQLLPADVVDSLATAVSDHDPFRLTRVPSDVEYTPDLQGGVAPSPPPAAKPTIALSGIVGPPWAAVFEGVPGHDGSAIAKVGDTLSRAPFALLVVRHISRDTVVVRAADTTWKLSVREAWR